MKVIIEDADTACPQINIEDLSESECINKLTCLLQLFEYQTQYWQVHKKYAPTLESLIENIDPQAYNYMTDALTRAKKYFRSNGYYPQNIEDLKGWEDINI